MALTFTPGQFSRRSELYHQLGQMTSAGVGLVRALDQLSRHPPSRSYRAPLRKLYDSLAQGFTFAESLERLGSWLPPFDIALLHAGEQSGRLDASFKMLSDHYRDRAAMARRVITDLAYPVLLIHFAVLVFSFVKYVGSADWTALMEQVALFLLPIYALTAMGIYALQSRHAEGWRALIELLLRPVPVLGTARHSLALARLAASLEALLSAGVGIIEAWEIASAASGSPALRRTVRAWRPLIQAGQTPAELLAGSRCFPEIFADQYATGEVSGKLDETLGRLHRYYQEEGARKLDTVAQWSPRAVYFIVALAIAYQVVSFWSGYFRTIQNVLGGF